MRNVTQRYTTKCFAPSCLLPASRTDTFSLTADFLEHEEIAALPGVKGGNFQICRLSRHLDDLFADGATSAGVDLSPSRLASPAVFSAWENTAAAINKRLSDSPASLTRGRYASLALIYLDSARSASARN